LSSRIAWSHTLRLATALARHRSRLPLAAAWCRWVERWLLGHSVYFGFGYARRMGQPTQTATNYTARSNIEPAQICPHANGQSAPRPGGARDVGSGAGSHTPSTASESFSPRAVSPAETLAVSGHSVYFGLGLTRAASPGEVRVTSGDASSMVGIPRANIVHRRVSEEALPPSSPPPVGPASCSAAREDDDMLTPTEYPPHTRVNPASPAETQAIKPRVAGCSDSATQETQAEAQFESELRLTRATSPAETQAMTTRAVACLGSPGTQAAAQLEREPVVERGASAEGAAVVEFGLTRETQAIKPRVAGCSGSGAQGTQAEAQLESELRLTRATSPAETQAMTTRAVACLGAQGTQAAAQLESELGLTRSYPRTPQSLRTPTQSKGPPRSYLLTPQSLRTPTQSKGPPRSPQSLRTAWEDLLARRRQSRVKVAWERLRCRCDVWAAARLRRGVSLHTRLSRALALLAAKASMADSEQRLSRAARSCWARRRVGIAFGRWLLHVEYAAKYGILCIVRQFWVNPSTLNLYLSRVNLKSVPISG